MRRGREKKLLDFCKYPSSTVLCKNNIQKNVKKIPVTGRTAIITDDAIEVPNVVHVSSA